jgi:hypothetical protein
MSSTTEKMETDAWETGSLGRSEEHVAVVVPEECKAVDDSLGLQLVSIRLQKSLIANLKVVATHHGLAYQPMIRDLLNRFVVSEMKNIMHELVKEAERQQAEAGGEESPVSEFLERERKRA